MAISFGQEFVDAIVSANASTNFIQEFGDVVVKTTPPAKIIQEFGDTVITNPHAPVHFLQFFTEVVLAKPIDGYNGNGGKRSLPPSTIILG